MSTLTILLIMAVGLVIMFIPFRNIIGFVKEN